MSDDAAPAPAGGGAPAAVAHIALHDVCAQIGGLYHSARDGAQSCRLPAAPGAALAAPPAPEIDVRPMVEIEVARAVAQE